jgi:hypothetical protein
VNFCDTRVPPGESTALRTTPNSIAGAFTVQYSTDLMNGYSLGPATPFYGFTDTNAPASPQRFYRLQAP